MNNGRAKASVILMGYSGHSYVVYDCLISAGYKVVGYCEKRKKTNNPFELKYFGSEMNKATLAILKKHAYFIAIGKNDLRQKIQLFLEEKLSKKPIIAIHSSSVISPTADVRSGVLVAPNVVINAGATVSEGTICNTSSIIEHDCMIGRFCHIAPGAVLCGSVKMGDGSFVGANSVIKEGVVIGKNVTIGAGSVIIRDIADNEAVVGNPQRIIKSRV